jgi:biotin synthase
MMEPDEIFRAALRAKEAGGWKFCIVTSARSPSEAELDSVCEAVEKIKRQLQMRVCTSLGILSDNQALRLKSAGVDRYNHNIETSRRFFPRICTTHSFDDRVNTIRAVRKAGMEVCCGGIVGMGESSKDVYDFLSAIHELRAESVPVNFLNPIPGTRLEAMRNLSPSHCLKVLALARFVNPSADIRAAGGREFNLRSLQPLALHIVSSIFTDGYLTTPGRSHNEDIKMICDSGFEVATVF